MTEFNNNQEKSQEPKDQKEKKRSGWGVILFLLFFLLLILSLILGVFFVRQRTSFWGRAFTPGIEVGEVALENSYLFASPLSAMADGKEKIRVTIFLLDSQGKGVPGKPVFLGQNEKLQIKAVQSVTDNLGRALFDIAAFTPADYLIEAKVENQILPQRVKLNFK